MSEPSQTLLLVMLMLAPLYDLMAQHEGMPGRLEAFIRQTMEDNRTVGSAITYFNENEDLPTRGLGKLEKSGTCPISAQRTKAFRARSPCCIS